MSNDNEHRSFEETIRQKLETHEVSVPGWEIFERSLNKRRKRRRMYLVAVSSVAAAVVLFTAVVKLPHAPKNLDVPSIVKVEDKPKPGYLAPETPAPDNNDSRRNTDSPSKTDTQTTVGTDADKRPDAVRQATLVINREDKSKLTVAEATVAVFPNASTDHPPLIGKGNIKIATELPMLKMLGTYEGDSDRHFAKLQPEATSTDSKQTNKTTLKRLPEMHDDNGWIASLTFGAENSQIANSRNPQFIAADPILGLENSKEYIKNTYKNEMMVPDNVEPDFSLPLSAKLSVRKNLSRRWAVESGVNYTFLSSKYQWNRNTVKQRMHYLGIPLNAVYYAVAAPQWNIYVSAGGTVEKCLHASLSGNERSAKIDVKNLQWSVNASIGATYKIARNVGLFMEPQIGYFFDNDQPESIRTAWPVAIGFGAGLRVSL